MKTNRQISALIIGAAVLLGAPAAFAGNITVADNNTGSNGYSEVAAAGFYSGGSWYSNSAEYGEVEPGMLTGAVWDLAAFVNPTTGRLGVLSGYNLGGYTDGTTIGDIFVAVNHGITPYADPNTPYPPYVLNSQYGYDFAVHFNFGNSTYSVIKLDGNTALANGEYNSVTANGQWYVNSNSASQPWQVATTLTGVNLTGANLGTVINTGTLSYYSSFTPTSSAQIALTGYNFTSDYHYYAEISTSWLAPYLNHTTGYTNDVTYKLTMLCGNDNMVGEQTAGFQLVPDGGATLSLLGISFLALCGLANFRKRLHR
jgi:hypothetical protein